MNTFRQILILSILCVTSAFASVAATTVKSVTKQKQAAQKEITETNKKLKQNTVQTNRQLNQLNRITAEITEQGVVIDTLKTQLGTISDRENSLNDSIELYKKQLEVLRHNYAIAVKKMHSHSTSMDKLLFVFSSDSFRQALRRMRYLKEFSSWRERQSHAITDMQQKLVQKRDQIKSLRLEKQNTLSAVNANQSQLEAKKGKQAQVISELKKEAGSLKTLLKEKERKAKALDRELDRLIAEQERKAAERAKAEAQRKQEAEAKRVAEQQRIADEKRKLEEQRQKEEAAATEAAKEKAAKEKPKKDKKPKKTEPAKTTPKVEQTPTPESTPIPQESETPSQSSGYMMNNEERTLSGSFESNKGRLLFPVTGGYKIVKPFGRQRHPELKYVETDNGGIDIETSVGANARAVFDGKVSVVFQTDGFNNVVMLRHGNYLTVYVNLSQIYVSSGQSVKAGQSIGKIFSDPEDDNRTILHFELRKEKTKLNPQEWLK